MFMKTSHLCASVVSIGVATPSFLAATSTDVVEPPVSLNVEVVSTPPPDTYVGQRLECEVVLSVDTPVRGVTLLLRVDPDREHGVMEFRGRHLQRTGVGCRRR